MNKNSMKNPEVEAIEKKKPTLSDWLAIYQESNQEKRPRSNQLKVAECLVYVSEHKGELPELVAFVRKNLQTITFQNGRREYKFSSSNEREFKKLFVKEVFPKKEEEPKEEELILKNPLDDVVANLFGENETSELPLSA